MMNAISSQGVSGLNAALVQQKVTIALLAKAQQADVQQAQALRQLAESATETHEQDNDSDDHKLNIIA